MMLLYGFLGGLGWRGLKKRKIESVEQFHAGRAVGINVNNRKEF